MPTYEYRCAEGHHFEQFQRMSEPPIDRCPQCGAAAERQLSSGAGILFKGSGFYITDYRSESYKKAAAAEGGDGGKKSDPGTESKPAASSAGAADSKPAKPSGSGSGSGTKE